MEKLANNSSFNLVKTNSKELENIDNKLKDIAKKKSKFQIQVLIAKFLKI